MGHIRINRIDMVLDFIRIEGDAVHVAGTDDKRGVNQLGEGAAVADGVKFHVQVVVANVSEQKHRIDVFGRPVVQRKRRITEGVLAIDHRMGDTFVGDGGGGILVRQFGH